MKLTRAERGRPALDETFVALDLETTGREAAHDVAVEVGAVRFKGDGTVLDEFATLISGPPSSEEARDCHHIDEEDRVGAPSGEEVWGELLDFLRGSVVVAHNADFEQPFLEAAALRHRLQVRDLPLVCTLQEARRHFDGRAFSLKALHRHATGEWREDTHQALGDARATMAVLLWMIRTSPQPLLITGDTPQAGRPSGATCKIRCRPAPLREPSVRALLRALPRSMMDRAGDVAGIETYLELLDEVLDDGRLTYQEVSTLSKQAVRTGLAGPQLLQMHHAAFNETFGAMYSSNASPSRLRQMATAADALGLTELAESLSSQIPAIESKEPPLPRLLRGRRYAFLGDSGALATLKHRALENGAPEVKNVTKTVLWAATDDPVGQTRQHRQARELGIPIVSVAEARARLEEDIAQAEQKRFEREQEIAAQEAQMERYRQQAAKCQEERDAFWAPSWRDREHHEDPGPSAW